jgi:hypothetical protein
MIFSTFIRRRTRPVLALAFALLITVGLAEPGAAVPDELQPPSGHKLYLVGHAEGVQTYSCQPTAAGYGWVFVSPLATLTSDNGTFLTSHYAGPTWEAKDGSKVVGRRVAGAPSPTGAIPWLLLEAASTSAGPARGDRLVHTTYIQRINTTGGATPPAAECDASSVGTAANVPYTADYLFFKATGAGAGG